MNHLLVGRILLVSLLGAIAGPWPAGMASAAPAAQIVDPSNKPKPTLPTADNSPKKDDRPALPDNSLTPEEYVRLGMPPLNRKWTAKDMEEAARCLKRLAD